MQKSAVKALSFISLLIFLCGYVIYKLHFPHTGSRSGHVLDSVTEKPIEGAVICYIWVFSPVMGMDRKGVNFETVTDKDGRYFVPSQRAVCPNILLYGPLQNEKVLIYKDGYAVYKVYGDDKPPLGRSFGYPDNKQFYRKKDNVVKLYPWKQDESHAQHVSFIESYGGNSLLNKELEPEERRAEQESLEKPRQK